MLVSDIYPLVLAPLFNKYTPLEDGELRNEILHLANKLKFPLKGVYTVDGSKRSDHSNAYVIHTYAYHVEQGRKPVKHVLRVLLGPYNRDHLPDKVLLFYGPYGNISRRHTSHSKVIPYRERGRDCMDS